MKLAEINNLPKIDIKATNCAIEIINYYLRLIYSKISGVENFQTGYLLNCLFFAKFIGWVNTMKYNDR
jgi:hypothetical protein